HPTARHRPLPRQRAAQRAVELGSLGDGQEPEPAEVHGQQRPAPSGQGAGAGESGAVAAQGQQDPAPLGEALERMAAEPHLGGEALVEAHLVAASPEPGQETRRLAPHCRASGMAEDREAYPATTPPHVYWRWETRTHSSAWRAMPGASSPTFWSNSSRLPWGTNSSGSAILKSGVVERPWRSSSSCTALPKPPMGTFSSTVMSRPTERARPRMARSSSGLAKRAFTTVAEIPSDWSVSAAWSAGSTMVPSPSSATSPPARSFPDWPIGMRAGSRAGSASSGMLARG